MATKVPDPVEKNARLWKAARTMIHRHGADWREHLHSSNSERVDEILALLGGIEDWASRALDEAEDARIMGDLETQLDRACLLSKILASGRVTFH